MNLKEPSQIKIIAHRGGAGEAFENSLSAFNKASRSNCYGMECDVQISLDRIPLIFHDRSLYKFNLFNRRLKQYPYHEIKKFSKVKYHQWSISGKSILKYEDFLKKFIDQKPLFIELKSRAHDQKDGTSEFLLESLTRTHKGFNHQKLAKHFFMSFDHDLLKKLKSKSPKLKVIYLNEAPENWLNKKMTMMGNVIGFPIRKLNHKLMTWAVKNKLQTLVYTCNGPRQLKRCIEHKVDYLVTDQPTWACRELSKYV